MQIADIGDWPWATILGASNGATSFTVVCGGSLITPNRVLSAAHCFPGGRMNPRITHARLGEHNIRSSNDDPGECMQFEPGRQSALKRNCV